MAFKDFEKFMVHTSLHETVKTKMKLYGENHHRVNPRIYHV